MFFGILVIIFSTFIGYLLSRKYSKVKNFYCQFDGFNKTLKTEIAFSQKTLKEIIDYKCSENNDFVNNFISFLNDRENFVLTINYLSLDEKNFLLEYYESVGKTEKNSQLEFLKKADEVITSYQKSAIELEKKYKNLYIKLGFLIGLIIFILII